MARRYLSIWFKNLKTDWFSRKNTELANTCFVLASPNHGRMVITASTSLALAQGIVPGTAVADARAILPDLVVLDDQPGIELRLLTNIADWCIRFSPVVSVDLPAGILIETTGCAHLWGGEENYINDISKKLSDFGYNIKMAMADTVGTAWAIARYGKVVIIQPNKQLQALLSLPPAALRLDHPVAERLEKLGLSKIENFISMPGNALRRRFGVNLPDQIEKATGVKEENIISIVPVQPYSSRLPSPEPIVTATGISIAVERLLEDLCDRLRKEQKGIRSAKLSCFRVDGRILSVDVGTHQATTNTSHLYKLFDLKIGEIEPAAGLELFLLEALVVETTHSSQEILWSGDTGLDDTGICRLIDHISNKSGSAKISRFVPAAHHWPERSYEKATSLHQELTGTWAQTRPRPVKVLNTPEVIGVSAPVPDYPPMLFRYKGKVHQVKKADGPERIEREWWIESGEHRDYYCVEDQDGMRYWIFRSGHYDTEKKYQWFLHGFFC